MNVHKHQREGNESRYVISSIYSNRCRWSQRHCMDQSWPCRPFHRRHWTFCLHVLLICVCLFVYLHYFAPKMFWTCWARRCGLWPRWEKPCWAHCVGTWSHWDIAQRPRNGPSISRFFACFASQDSTIWIFVCLGMPKRRLLIWSISPDIRNLEIRLRAEDSRGQSAIKRSIFRGFLITKDNLPIGPSSQHQIVEEQDRLWCFMIFLQAIHKDREVMLEAWDNERLLQTALEEKDEHDMAAKPSFV